MIVWFSFTLIQRRGGGVRHRVREIERKRDRENVLHLMIFSSLWHILQMRNTGMMSLWPFTGHFQVYFFWKPRTQVWLLWPVQMGAEMAHSLLTPPVLTGCKSSASVRSRSPLIVSQRINQSNNLRVTGSNSASFHHFPFKCVALSQDDARVSVLCITWCNFSLAHPPITCIF